MMSLAAVMLTVILVMPPDKDDLKQDRAMPSIEECWSAARVHGHADSGP